MEVFSIEDSNGIKNDFDVLTFERKIVELVEELRLRRNLEVENEKALKSCMEEKYKVEIELDEQRRRYNNEKDALEQQLGLYRRKLEDNVCVSDDEKVKQQIVNKTYSQELRIMKEELRKASSEKLTLTKKIQALESQLKLHSSYQESIVKQIVEIRNRFKSTSEECAELKVVQQNVMDNVTEAKLNFERFEQSSNHLQQCIELVEKKNEALKKDFVLCRSELTMLKNSTQSSVKMKHSTLELEKLRERNLELEKLFLQSRKENENTLRNLVESNKKLCELVNKYSDAQKKEKSMLLELGKNENDISSLHSELGVIQKELLEFQEKDKLKQENYENNYKDAATQTTFVNMSTNENELSKISHTISENKQNNVKDVGKRCSSKECTTTEIKRQPETLTFAQIVKRKRDLMEEDANDSSLLSEKKVCINNTNTEIDLINKKRMNQTEEDISVPSSLNNSQDSITGHQYANKMEEANNTVGMESGTTKDAEIKELINVEKNLQNLQVFDK